MLYISVLNQSTAVADTAVESMVPALETQWNRDLRPVWGIDRTAFVHVPKRRTPRRGPWWLVFLDDSKTHKEDVLGHLNELGATYENANGTLYAIDLKPDVDFDPIADYLSECQESGWLEQRYAPQPQPKGTGDLLN